MPPKHKSPSLDPSRPLSALLSQTLVAYTVEFDNEFERRMSEAGHPGAGLSLTLWHTVMRFLNDDGIAVESLESKFALGCLERWRFITLQPAPTDTRPTPRAFHRMAGRELRQGWGSARGIRDEWIVRPTTRGRAAMQIWPPLFNEIDQRWNHRFGSEIISALRRTLTEVAAQRNTTPANAPTDPDPVNLPLPALLSRLLIAFAYDFNRESKVPIELCANPIRVLGKTSIPERDIPRLTGTSPETSGIGWQLKPFITVQRDPHASRGKVVRLNARGLAVQSAYHQLVQEIEKRWEQRVGAETIRHLRRQLEQLFTLRDSEGRLLLAVGLLPPPGVRRSGQQAPSLGRRAPGPAALQRMRDLVEQTAEFVKDPANSLPHYPLWDINRGFGP